MVVWILIAAFLWLPISSVSAAQQPTATINQLNGTLLVNGRPAETGAILSAGDVIETQAGASLVLELSDGSLLELGENTSVDLAELSQTATGARVSRVKLLWGRIRAKLSPGHQHTGSAFDIETPNALVGVKFSEPDIEVNYNLERMETMVLAYTVALTAKNLITGEEMIIPVGTAAVITGVGIQVLTGAATPGATGSESSGAGTSSTTTTSAATSGGISSKTVLSFGAVVAAGVAAAIYLPELSEESCDTINAQYTTDGEIIRTPEGIRCTIHLSTGFGDDEAEAHNALAYILYEVRVDNLPARPENAIHVTYGENGWHVQQEFRTDELQKGDHHVEAIVHNTRFQRTFIKRFTIRAE